MPSYKPQRERKRKRRDLVATKGGADHGDPNAVEIRPANQAERKAKREALRAAAQEEQPKMSSKKRKRLDNKLREDENQDLLRKLSAAAFKVDTSLLQSTKDLGAGKGTKRQALVQAWKQQKAGLSNFVEPGSSEGDSLSGLTSDDEEQQALKKPTVEPFELTTLGVGQGLKRPLEIGPDGHPVLQRKRRLRFTSDSNLQLKLESDSKHEESLSESSWKGLSTSASSSNDEGSGAESSNIENNSSVDDSDVANLSSINSEDEAIIRSSLFAIEFQGPIGENYDVPRKVELRSKEKRAEFKEWALRQMDEARDFQASTLPTKDEQLRPKNSDSKDSASRESLRQPLDAEPLPPELQAPSNTGRDQVYSVTVERSDSIQKQRLELPVVADEQKIMEMIHNNDAVIICGATGSGKTTQIPQFLYEAGYGSHGGPTPGMIGITQPRRIAAVTTAKRVGEELGQAAKVSYQIRFEKTETKATAIKFMTDGILIRELGEDFALKKYSVIVVDEAHERSVNTDILIGILSRVVWLRGEMNREDPKITRLKMIIMSATLATETFTNNPLLWHRILPPPLIQSEGRQHSVTTHFARKTSRNYVEEAFRKISRGHKKLPPGAMLVFLTGQNEIRHLARKLKDMFHHQVLKDDITRYAAKDAPQEIEDLELGDDDRVAALDPVDGVEDYASSSENDEFEHFKSDECRAAYYNIQVLPLYAQLPAKEQLRVFETSPENTRNVILATNVAETSITIPGIRYVFDCGRAKERHFDPQTGVQSFRIGWISKDSAKQREGRAGRTGPGHCYRLYSSAVFERDFKEHAVPEIRRTPVDSVVLQLKAMNLQNVLKFPFPTPPEEKDLVSADALLRNIGAVSASGNITQLGKDLSIYPLSPRLSRVLSLGHQHGCMYLAVALVAALATADIFIPENQITGLSEDHIEESGEDEDSNQLKKSYREAQQSFSKLDPFSDSLKALYAFGNYTWLVNNENPEAWCADNFVRAKAMKEAYQLFEQLLSIVAANRPGLIDPSRTRLVPPKSIQVSALKQMIVAGYLDQVAIRWDLSPEPPMLERRPRRTVDVPYLPLIPIHGGSVELHEKAVFIHPSSILTKLKLSRLPQYIVYSQLQEASSSTTTGHPKKRMHALADASPSILAAFAKDTPLMQYSKPIGNIEIVPNHPDQRICWLKPTLIGRKGMAGWPLREQKVLQRRIDGQWVNDKIIS